MLFVLQFADDPEDETEEEEGDSTDTNTGGQQ